MSRHRKFDIVIADLGDFWVVRIRDRNKKLSWQGSNCLEIEFYMNESFDLAHICIQENITGYDLSNYHPAFTAQRIFDSRGMYL